MGVLENFTKETGHHIFDLGGGRRIELDAEDILNIFKGYRPRLLDAKDFRIVSRIIKKEVDQYVKKGTMMHLSKVSPEVWREYFEKGLVNKHSQKGYTYIKKEDEEEN
jgi:hypothetical protein